MTNMPQTVEPFLSFFSLPWWAIITDVSIFALAVLAVIYTIYLWRGQVDRSSKQAQETDDGFRHRQDLGQRGVTAQLNAGLTSSTVLLAGAFALLGLARDPKILFSPAARTQVVIGAIWFIISIFTGIWNAGVIAPKSSSQDVSKGFSINIMLAIQLWTILIGGISILLSLFLVK